MKRYAYLVREGNSFSFVETENLKEAIEKSPFIEFYQEFYIKKEVVVAKLYPMGLKFLDINTSVLDSNTELSNVMEESGLYKFVSDNFNKVFKINA